MFDGEHVWCSNRALNSITFEDCSITNLHDVGVLCADKDEPLDFRLKNVRLSASSTCADLPILEAKNCKYVEFDNVTVEGYNNPHVVSDRSGVVKIIGGTPVDVVVREEFEFTNPYVENMKTPIIKYK